MKKIAVLVLVLFIAMALCSCGNNSPEIADLQSRLDALEQESKDLKEQSQKETIPMSEEEYKTFALNWADGVRKELEKQNILIKEATINQALLKDSDWINKMVDSASK